MNGTRRHGPYRVVRARTRQIHPIGRYPSLLERQSKAASENRQIDIRYISGMHRPPRRVAEM